MRKISALLGVSACLTPFLFQAHGASSPTAQEVIDRLIAAQEAKSELAFVRMRRWVPPTPEPQEYRFLIAYQRGEKAGVDYFFRMIRPEDVEGVSLLVRNDGTGDVKRFLYLPALGKARELTGNARYQPFINSDFTYADLEREVPRLHSYERLADAKVDGVDCYKIRAVEKDRPEGAPYAYRDLLIDKAKNRLQRVEFFDKGGKLVKFLTAHEYDSPEIEGATKRPRRLVMKNATANSYTEFMVLQSRLDEKFDKDVFTTARLENWKDWEIEEFIFQYGMTITGD